MFGDCRNKMSFINYINNSVDNKYLERLNIYGIL